MATTVGGTKKEADDEIQMQCTEEDWDNVPMIVTDHKSGRSYTRGRLLGKGGFARCFLFRNTTTGEEIAGKVVLKKTLTKERTKKKLISEIKIHNSLKHHKIVQFQHYFEDTNCVYMMMELCDNKSMMELMKKRQQLSEPEAQFYIKQLVDGVAYLHQNLVIHRDLKLGNLFLDKDLQVKIGDFGLATQLDRKDERKVTICGTPNYLAPEILDGAKAGGHSFEVDIWSIGVILFTVLVGKPPFETSNVRSTYKKIRNAEYQFPPNIKISDQAKSLIRRILTRSPEARPTLAQIEAHDFFRIPNLPPSHLPISALDSEPHFSSGMSLQAKFGSLSLVSQTSQQQLQQLTKPVTTLPLSQQAQRRLMEDKENSPMKQNQRRLTEDKENSPMKQNQLQLQPVLPTKPEPVEITGIDTEAEVLQQLLKHIQSRIPANYVVPTSTTVEKRTHPISSNGNVKLASFHVARWVDYTSKYGMGYLLSDGSIGVYFNDATKILLSRNGNDFAYYNRSNQPQSSDLTSGGFKQTLSHYDPSLEKKVVLLKHFRDYLIQQEKASPSMSSLSSNLPTSTPFVKKWLKTKHALFFRLSDDTVQVKFHDRSELIVANTVASTRSLTFIDRKLTKESILLDQVQVEERPDIGKRLKYLKDIIQLLLEQQPQVV